MNSKEEQTNSEVTNLENESLIEQQSDLDYINEQIGGNKLDDNSTETEKDADYIKEETRENELEEKSIDIEDEYKFGWSSYSEITNGRFAMIGFLAIILIELFSKQSFLKWAGIL